MGRFADLCGEVAAALEDDVNGLTLPPDARDRFRADWADEDIEDAMALVQDSLLQGELIDAADSLSSRMVEWLAEFGGAKSFSPLAETGEARVSVETIGQLTRRVARLEETLAQYREGGPPENPDFEVLRRRLADHGIEEEMARDRSEDESFAQDGDDEDY
jgi:hypothetical protein